MSAHRLMVLFSSIALALPGVLAARSGDDAPPPRIEYFYTEGCETCYRVNHEILPQLEAYTPAQYELIRYDIDVDTNYLRLAAYQDTIEIDEHASSVLIVNGRQPFDSWESIEGEFLDYVGQVISGAILMPEAEPSPPDTLSLERLERRARNFTFMGVALAGLIDGINPCAISTLVFFISMLSVMKIRGSHLIWAGVAFCATCFATYMAIGFGLFHLLYLFTGFPAMRRGLELSMIALLLLLALLSLRDALRYRAGGRPEDVTLKLPRRIKDTIHRVIRSGLSTHRIIWGSILTSFLVTVLESVCTGQVYVPTLVLVLRSGQSVPLVLGYLLLYNTLFILPLVLALILAYHGTRTERFVHWSRDNVVPSKLAMAALFIALAALIAML